MDDEVLSGLPALVRVLDTGVYERLLDASAVDLSRSLMRVLLDDREQVAQQPTLGKRQVGTLDRPLRIRSLDAIDRRAGRPYDRCGRSRAARTAAPGCGATVAIGARAVIGQRLAWRFSLLRNRRPSSCLVV
jgi:hypothetical protein